jgi:hypothetical protein
MLAKAVVDGVEAREVWAGREAEGAGRRGHLRIRS